MCQARPIDALIDALIAALIAALIDTLSTAPMAVPSQPPMRCGLCFAAVSYCCKSKPGRWHYRVTTPWKAI
jgi:hypothetical protein